MNVSKYETTIILLIKLFRRLRYVKQLTVANALNMSKANYSKIEAGYWSINVQQLRLICDTIGITLSQLIALADAYEDEKYRVTPLSHTLVNVIKTFENNNGELILENVQLDRLIGKIRGINLSPLYATQHSSFYTNNFSSDLN